MRHLITAFCLLGSTAAVAQPVPTPQKPCTAAEHRQFDFWVGTWDVTSPDGKAAGRNVIEPILGGCTLSEHWKGVRGLEGFSFNTYDRATGKWHQTWVDSAGTRLALAGGLQGTSMVLEDEGPSDGTGRVRQRITWTPAADGSVRQHWQSSRDSGATWTTVFDGTYRRAPGDGHPAAAGSAAGGGDEEAIRSLLARTEAANNAGDVTAWVNLFSDDAVYMPPGGPAVTTRAGLVEVAEAGFRHRTTVTIEPQEIVVAGDWAFARTRVAGSVKLHGTGENVPVDVKQVVVYRREGAGGWKIARLIANSNGS